MLEEARVSSLTLVARRLACRPATLKVEREPQHRSLQRVRLLYCQSLIVCFKMLLEHISLSVSSSVEIDKTCLSVIGEACHTLLSKSHTPINELWTGEIVDLRSSCLIKLLSPSMLSDKGVLNSSQRSFQRLKRASRTQAQLQRSLDAKLMEKNGAPLRNMQSS